MTIGKVFTDAGLKLNKFEELLGLQKAIINAKILGKPGTLRKQDSEGNF